MHDTDNFVNQVSVALTFKRWKDGYVTEAQDATSDGTSAPDGSIEVPNQDTVWENC